MAIDVKILNKNQRGSGDVYKGHNLGSKVKS